MPKYVSWIPTDPDYIDSFFKLCPVTPSDVVYDLGSGDGRLLFAALEKGVGRAIGVDMDPELVNTSRETATYIGVENRVTFIEADIMSINLSEATVVLCYLFPTANAELRPKFEKELRPGTRVVTETFPIINWKPLKVAEDAGRIFYLYIMPTEETESYLTAFGTSLDDY
jgi:ribosomal protein L11 methylase PrmA